MRSKFQAKYYCGTTYIVGYRDCYDNITPQAYFGPGGELADDMDIPLKYPRPP